MRVKKLFQSENRFFSSIADCTKTIDIEPNVNYQERAGEESTEDIMTLEECQSICQNRDGCYNFVWHHGNAGYYSYQCITMTGYGTKYSNSDCVSGSISDNCVQKQGNVMYSFTYICEQNKRKEYNELKSLKVAPEA